MAQSFSEPAVRVRTAHFAGTWYPGAAGALHQAIESYLAQAAQVETKPARMPGRVIALVSPHPGLRFCGPVAAHVYALVRGQPFRRVILLGPLHRPIWGSKPGAFMVPAQAVHAYQMPLGNVAIDRDFVHALAERVPLTEIRDDQEHALELQLPFLQVALESFTLVPILLGEHIGDPGALQRLVELSTAVADLADEHTLLVATTDLSHLDNHADVRAIDQRTLALVNAFDVDGLAAALIREDVYACGATALVAVLKAARQLRATGAQVLAYSTSGDISGDKRPGNYTVGYMAAAVYG